MTTNWTCPFCGSQHDGESPFDDALDPFAFVGDDERPAPHVLYQQTGGGDAYRVAMLEHGYVLPSPPWRRKGPGKTLLPCGLVHEFNWSEWRTFRDGGRMYEGRWCQTCALTQVREMP